MQSLQLLFVLTLSHVVTSHPVIVNTDTVVVERDGTITDLSLLNQATTIEKRSELTNIITENFNNKATKGAASAANDDADQSASTTKAAKGVAKGATSSIKDDDNASTGNAKAAKGAAASAASDDDNSDSQAASSAKPAKGAGVAKVADAAKVAGAAAKGVGAAAKGSGAAKGAVAAKEAAAAKGAGATTGAANSKDTKPTTNSVSKAVDNFDKDATLVSSALNSLPNLTNTKQIKTVAQNAFDAETDEDNQRSVLAAAAGSAGSSANSKIVQFTPAVLSGLKDIANKGTVDSVQKNLPAIEQARNPNILPSITKLSNAALAAMGLPQTAEKFPATGN